MPEDFSCSNIFVNERIPIGGNLLSFNADKNSDVQPYNKDITGPEFISQYGHVNKYGGALKINFRMLCP